VSIVIRALEWLKGLDDLGLQAAPSCTTSDPSAAEGPPTQMELLNLELEDNLEQCTLMLDIESYSGSKHESD
jgi:hypothetical protein